jgi:glycosyltransferase involved in cell wall biosynthesis
MTRAWIVDPPAFTPPYDHALCEALGAAGADVTLVTSRFAYGTVPPATGYRVRPMFYRHARGPAGSQLRRATKLAEHLPDMLRLRSAAGREADVVHFQWLGVPALDRRLLPRGPRVLTAHDLLPREPRRGQVRAHRALLERMDAVIVHSRYGRGQLVGELGLPDELVHVVPHGAFGHLADLPAAPLPAELPPDGPPVVLFFGLLRPYKGIETLLAAWRGITDAELWIVGRPMMDLGALRALATPGVRFVSRFVADDEVPALFRRASLVALPYTRTERFDQSGVLATALAFGRPAVLSAIGGFPEVAELGAAELVAPDDPAALHEVLARLLADPVARERLAAGARAAAAGPLSWTRAAERTLEVYRRIAH